MQQCLYLNADPDADADANAENFKWFFDNTQNFISQVLGKNLQIIRIT